MKGFRYKHGDRPLEGYTIERAAGRGGFGEVYYAKSDAGREVALKAVQGYEQIELRGISHCMNLKSPHLVSIFDVRRNPEGEAFVIMEFVNGPSLRELIDESPGGIGTQKAAFFLREIAKGLSYLHDCGIVHRDLKPGNIFYEDGYVKIGDYGLSKAMSGSVHSGQTITVGTVHYMAPEIGQGRYDRGIDIYALGAMLYEMLTGQTPHLGSSAGEILMKHLTAQPDVSGIDQPFARVILRAMSKDPSERYQTVQEMVEDVFGAAHVRESVSAFSPGDLSMVAGRVAGKVGVGESGKTQAGSEPGPKQAAASDEAAGEQKREKQQNQQRGSRGKRGGDWCGPGWGGPGCNAEWAEDFGRKMSEFGQKVGKIGAAIGSQIKEEVETAVKVAKEGNAKPGRTHPPQLVTMPERVSPFMRGLLVSAIYAVMGFGTGLAFGGSNAGVVALFCVLTSVGGTVGLSVANQIVHSPREQFGRVRGRLLCAIAATIGLLLLSVIAVNVHSAVDETLIASYWGIVIPIFLLHWPSVLKPTRAERISLRPVILGGLLGLAIGSIGDASGIIAGSVVATIALAGQVAAAWTPKRRVRPGESLDQQADIPLEEAEGDGAAGGEKRGPRVEASLTWETGRGKRHGHARPVVSPCKRWWAFLLVLGIFVGLPGLHRFYTGHIVSGIIWFFTGGLLGIGQLVDAILIIAGRFKDKQGKTLVVWHSFDELRFDDRFKDATPATEPQLPPQTPSGLSISRHTEAKGAPLSALAGVLLFLGMAIGVAAAVNVPQLVAVGFLGGGVPRQLTTSFGTAGWPWIAEEIGYLAAVVLLSAGAWFIMFARRESGLLHMLRAMLGIALFGAVVLCLREFTAGVNWDLVGIHLEADRLGPAIETLARTSYGPAAIGAAFLMALAIFMIAWPHRRREAAGGPQPALAGADARQVGGGGSSNNTANGGEGNGA